MSGSQSGSENVAWHEVVLRQKYNDPMKLKNSLDTIYGQGKYKVKTKSDRYILHLPEPVEQAQILEIEKMIRFHYSG